MQEYSPDNLQQCWKPPLSLGGGRLIKWPEGVFPSIFDVFVRELARSTETPIELAAMLTLSAVATASQKKYRVRLKDDYSEPVNLWVVAILPPASRKSKVYSEITRPLREWEYQRKKQLESDVNSISSRRKTMEARIHGLRAKAAKVREADVLSLQAEIERLESNLPEVPVYPRLWTSDVTSEHLGTLMSQNGGAMAILSDEGGIFDILGGLYSDGRANIDLLLQGHAGAPVRVDRGSRPPVFLAQALLTMGLTIQPQVVSTVCRNRTFRGRGLLGRFLYVIPASNIGKRGLDEPPIAITCVAQYHAAMQAVLADAQPNEIGMTAQHELCLSPDAYTKWKEYAQCVEGLMGDDIDRLKHISDWAGKLPGAIARIAGLLHVMRYAGDSPHNHKVSLEDMRAAVKIGHALSEHALEVFDIVQEDDVVPLAREIVKWLSVTQMQTFTQRDCLRKFRRVKKASVQPALDLLVDTEHIRECQSFVVSPRASRVFEVNPNIGEQSKRKSTLSSQLSQLS